MDDGRERRKIFKNKIERFLFLILTGAEIPFYFLIFPILIAILNAYYSNFDFKYFSIVCFLFYEYLISNGLFYFLVEGIVYFSLMGVVYYFFIKVS